MMRRPLPKRQRPQNARERRTSKPHFRKTLHLHLSKSRRAPVLEAKAAYAEKLEAKNSTLEQDKAALQKKVDAKGKDPDPVTSSGEGAAACTAGGEEFMTLSRQRTADKKISITGCNEGRWPGKIRHRTRHILDACSRKRVRHVRQGTDGSKNSGGTGTADRKNRSLL